MGLTEDLPGSTTTLRAKADELRKEGNYSEAAEYYAQLWPCTDKWVGWGYAFSLRKLRRINEAFEVGKALLELDPSFQYGRSICSWIAWDLMRAQTTASEVARRAKWIVRLTKDLEDPYAAVTPFVPAVLRAARAWCDAGRYRNAKAWLQQLDPIRLSQDEPCFTDTQGKTRRLGSAREKYYALKTRTLEKLGQWQECHDAAREALRCCPTLHHDNDIWFARRAALASSHCGQAAAAIAELEQLLTRKATTFIHVDIATIAHSIDEKDLAYRHTLSALVTPSELVYKLPALKLMARILAERGQESDARDHVELATAVRVASAWGSDAELAHLAIALGAESETPIESLLPSLTSRWTTWNENLNPRKSGTVEKLLPHGRAGFIRAQDGQRHYFDIREWKVPGRRLKERLTVTFSTASSFDKKRQCSTVVARDIRPDMMHDESARHAAAHQVH
ncbi:MAG: hypothetical protein M3Z54_02705 [Gemmatimonadota bacterium]|nr:hypothetical protein [Gemmatimonadota bacterium]